MNLYITGELHTRFELCYDFRSCPCGCAASDCPCRSDMIELDAPMAYDFDYEQEHYHIELRPGLPIDGASVPRFFWSTIGHPFDAGLLLFAVLHDYLYASELLPRNTADGIFLEMLQYTCSWWTRGKIKVALAVAGGAVWKAHTPESLAYARERIACTVAPAT